MFKPNEIIFSVTDACNLHCAHCFVSRNSNKIEIDAAINLLKSCKEACENNPELPVIDKVGFSGGEPFLYMDFLLSVTKAAVKMDFMFDQVMTNGDWWTDEGMLTEKLTALYEAGYDGKVGLSWDNFHGQNEERMKVFISKVQEVFGDEAIVIQTVIPAGAKTADISVDNVPVYTLPQTFPGDDPKAWKSRKWFRADFCQGPGNIFYVHSDGNIAPCCGFANENPQLFIGNINNSYEELLENAENNKMIQICFEKGLKKYRKELKHQGLIYPGKCNDNCSFCDYVCKIMDEE